VEIKTSDLKISRRCTASASAADMRAGQWWSLIGCEKRSTHSRSDRQSGEGTEEEGLVEDHTAAASLHA
jgi:hypothetical protein